MRAQRFRVVALVAGTALVAGGIVALSAGPASAAATGGVGATLPYVEVQAEDSATNATVIGPTAAYLLSKRPCRVIIETENLKPSGRVPAAAGV